MLTLKILVNSSLHTEIQATRVEPTFPNGGAYFYKVEMYTPEIGCQDLGLIYHHRGKSALTLAEAMLSYVRAEWESLERKW